ncbi:MAG TPA: DNA recombination protein RmuC, partial [bacterium]|nr:DNA recombination protein RmuC [bacterium]
KNKIKQVCTRDYISPEEHTVDFVILFIPNEMIFSYIYDTMNDVWEEAMNKKVILAGPFSFTAILRMVKQAYTNFSYQSNLQSIIQLIQKFDSEYQKYNEEVDKLGERIASTGKQFEHVSNTRHRQLSTIVDKIKSQHIIESKVSEGKLLEE